MITGIGGLPIIDGKPAFAVVATTWEFDEGRSSITYEVLAVAASKKTAEDIAYEFVPYVSRDACLSIEETEMVDF